MTISTSRISPCWVQWIGGGQSHPIFWSSLTSAVSISRCYGTPSDTSLTPPVLFFFFPASQRPRLGGCFLGYQTFYLFCSYYPTAHQPSSHTGNWRHGGKLFSLLIPRWAGFPGWNFTAGGLGLLYIIKAPQPRLIRAGAKAASIPSSSLIWFTVPWPPC